MLSPLGPPVSSISIALARTEVSAGWFILSKENKQRDEGKLTGWAPSSFLDNFCSKGAQLRLTFDTPSSFVAKVTLYKEWIEPFARQGSRGDPGELFAKYRKLSFLACLLRTNQLVHSHGRKFGEPFCALSKYRMLCSTRSRLIFESWGRSHRRERMSRSAPVRLKASLLYPLKYAI